MQLHALKQIYLLILTILFVSSCNDGGGVITNTKEIPPTVTVYAGPFGGPIVNDQVIPPPTPYETNYTSYDLEQMIIKANDNDIIQIDKNVDMNYSIEITKPITLKSIAGKRIKITGQNLIQLFSLANNNINFDGIDFYMYNTEKMLNSQLDNVGNPVYGMVNITNSSFYLSGKSQAKIYANDLLFKNNSIFGFTTVIRPISLVDLTGNNLNIYANNIIDMTNNYQGGLLVNRSMSGNIKENFIYVYAQLFNGAISIDSSSNYNVESNSLYDNNSTRVKNNGFNLDPDNDGSIAISIRNSSNIFDNSKKNKYNAIHYLISDSLSGLPGASSGLGLSSIQSVVAVDFSKMFNHISSSDYTPICLIGQNPAISIIPFLNGNSYLLNSAQLLYYSGSIKPACL